MGDHGPPAREIHPVLFCDLQPFFHSLGTGHQLGKDEGEGVVRGNSLRGQKLDHLIALFRPGTLIITLGLSLASSRAWAIILSLSVKALGSTWPER